MRPTPVAAAYDNNSYRSGGGDSYSSNSNSNSSKYRSAADDMKNIINGSNDSYKSMKGNDCDEEEVDCHDDDGSDDDEDYGDDDEYDDDCDNDGDS